MKTATKAAVTECRKTALAACDFDMVDTCDRALAKGKASPEWARVSRHLAPTSEAIGLVEILLKGQACK